MVNTADFHARVRGSVPGLSGLKETKMFLPHSRVKVSIMGSLCDREVACSASDRQGSNFECCVWRTVSPQSSHHPQEALQAQFSLYVHKNGLKPDSFHFTNSNVFLSKLQWIALAIPPSNEWKISTNNYACFNLYDQLIESLLFWTECVFKHQRFANVYSQIKPMWKFKWGSLPKKSHEWN